MTTDTPLMRVPENTSFLQPTKYTFIIPNLPFARYFCQTVNMPSVSVTPITQLNPFSDIFRHGLKLDYDQLTMSFLVDEDLRVWEETYNWLRSTAMPTKFEEYAKHFNKETPIYYDGILTINTNANIPNVRYKFRNCHPVSLSGVTFSTSDNADNVITSELGIRYDYFEIERV